MPQIKVVLKDAEYNFVDNYAKYGFKSKTELVNEAVSAYRNQLISKSAELYEEVYQEDSELRELTNDAAGLCLD